MMNRLKKGYCRVSLAFALAVLVFVLLYSFIGTQTTYAASMDPNDVELDEPNTEEADATGDRVNGISVTWDDSSGNLTTPVRMLLVLTILSLAPSLLIMLTSFTRIIIVLHFVRTAVGTQSAPPNQVLVGLALFLTFFIMWPTFQKINTEAIQPLDAGEITQEEALGIAEDHIREFMINDAKLQVRDLNVFVEISGQTYEEVDDIPFTTMVPAFILSELRAAFIMGFLIYIPFIVIDMVVSSVLMSMGMMMLPPTTISMPFKILLFLLADGWDLVVTSVVRTFY